MTEKPKVAFYWCASCGGCEEAVLDLGEKILDVTQAVDIAFWPVALDYKRDDVERLPARSLLASLINGAIRGPEQEEMAHLLRGKSQIVVAFGACAQLGGIPGLANFSTRRALLDEAYLRSPSTVNPDAVFPLVAELDEKVRPLDQVIDVDYYLPGCPPVPGIIASALEALLSGAPPPRGSVLAPDRALCEECARKDSKPDKLTLASFQRTSLAFADESKCLLAQGFPCLGSATRGGCGALCIAGNMPCTGCFGPTSRVRDFGAKALSALGASIEATEPQSIDAVLDSIPDAAGLFYRYSLAASRLMREPSCR